MRRPVGRAVGRAREREDIPAPVITNVDYDGSSLTVRWDPVESEWVNGYRLVGGPTAWVDTENNWYTWNDVVLDPEVDYQLRVWATLDQVQVSPPSEPAPVIVAAPVLETLDYEGTYLAAGWSAVEEEAVDDYLAVLTGGGETREETFAESPGVMEGSLDPSVEYAYGVQAGGTAGSAEIRGPFSNLLAPLTEAPVLTRVEYDLEVLNDRWEAVGEAGVEGYLAEVYGSGGGESYQQSQETAETSASFEAVLDPEGTYETRVRALGDGGAVAGPWSEPVPVITQAPLLELASYSGEALTGSWTAVDQAGVELYRLRVLGGPRPRGGSYTETTGTLEIVLDPALAYTASVRARSRNTRDSPWVLGPRSEEVALIAAPPQGVTLDYSGDRFLSRWQAVDEVPVKGYRADFRADGELLASVDTEQTAAELVHGMEPGVRYTVQVRATGDNALGPESEPVAGPFTSRITYRFDALARLESLTLSSGETVIYTRDAAGNVLRVQASAAAHERAEG